MTPVRPFPALLIRRGSKRVLVVADLHIGWEATLTQRGVHVPSQTSKILDKVLQLVKEAKPTEIVFLGDVKHTISGVEIEEWRDIPDFFEAIEKVVPNIQIIPGNHDGSLEPLLPETVGILSPKGMTIGDVGLFHGHAWPAPELLGCRSLVTAHVHPMVVFRDLMGFRITRQVWVRTKCNGLELAKPLMKHLGMRIDQDRARLLQDHFNVKPRFSQLLIMPSFNDFLGGQPVNKKSLGKDRKSKSFIGPVLRSGSVNIEAAEIYLLDGTFLGTIGQLRGFS